MRVLVSLMAVMVAAGCASPAKDKQWRNMSFEEPADKLANEIAMQRSGQAVVHEAYVQSGVIVTPARNWMYGQTEGYANEPVQTLSDRDWLAYASAQYGGVMTGEVAERAGTGRSVKETQAIEQLTAIGKFKSGKRGKADASDGSAKAPTPSNMKGVPGLFDPNKLVTYLGGVDPESIPSLPGLTQTKGLKLATPRFDLGKADLKLADSRSLALNGKELAAYNGLILVAGFTDPSGTEATNVGLAERRAQITASRLEAGGVSAFRLGMTGKPLCCYLNDNASEAKRAANRRAEVRLGGVFARAEARTAEDVGQAIAQVFKAIGGNESRRLIVYGIAPDGEVASALGILLKQVLTSGSVGHRNVVVGDALVGGKAEVVIEIGI